MELNPKNKIDEKCLKKASEQLSIPESEVKQIVDLFFKALLNAIEMGESIHVKNFGTWIRSERKTQIQKERFESYEIAKLLMDELVKLGFEYTIESKEEVNNWIKEFGGKQPLSHKTLKKVFTQKLYKNVQKSTKE